MNNSKNAFLMPQTPSSTATVIVLKGYVPATRNALKGTHWSVLFNERKRAAVALRSALQSMPSDLPIGTDGTSKNCKTALFTLASWMAMTGICWKGTSLPKRFTRSPKKEPK